MSKLKFIRKLLLGTFVIIVFSSVALFFSEGEVSAHEWSCPDNGKTSTPPDNWGIHDGEQSHGMAGLSVRVRDVNGKPLDGVSYELRSDVPGMSGTIRTQNDEVVDVDDRIFKWRHKYGSEPVFEGRTNAKTFRSNELLSLKQEDGQHIYPSPQRCSGWSVLGPGEAGINIGGKYVIQWGNEWVLDCAQPDSNGDGQPEFTDFWISKIGIPSGDDGEYGGRWEVITPKRIGSGGGNNSRFLDQGSDRFNVKNGESRQVTLVWHPNPRPQKNPVLTACNYLEVGGSKLNRRKVEVTNVTSGLGRLINPDNSTNDWTHGPNFTEWVPAPVGQEVNPGSYTKKWWYKATGVQINIKVTEYAWNGSRWVETVLRNDTPTCYDATCDLSMSGGNVLGHPSGLQSRSDFSITAHVHNRATPPNSTELYATVNDRPLILAANVGGPVGFFYNPGGSDGLNKGQHSYRTWDFQEPGNPINNYGVGAKLYYDFNGAAGYQSGQDLLVADCTPTSYSVFKQFDLTPVANIEFLPNGDSEDPSDVRFTGQGNGTVPDYPGGINVGYSSTEQATPYGGGTSTTGHSGTGRTAIVHSHNSAPISPTNAGDRYAMNFCLHQAHGWIGPGNAFSSDTYGECDDADARIYNKPYMRVYGADIMAGNVCGGGGANDIKSYISSRSTKTGSGSQLSVFALGSIDGFISASLRYALAQPQPKKGLTFANTGAGSGEYGGNFGAGLCPTDYFASRDDNSPNLPSSGSLAGIRNSSGKYNATGPITLSGGGSQTGQKAIYVEGNVYISSNITYLGGGYSSLEGLPRFTLIASGNIYIAPGVSTLDGTYIAGGKISTCATSGGSYSTAQLWGMCRGNPLTINGAFIAPEVDFLRSRGSLRQSLRSSDSITRTNAAEIFVYSPEVYLAPLIGGSAGGGGGSGIYQPKSYDAITTLPPIL